MLSTSFSRSVVLITRHDARGTLGVIVNRRTRFKLPDVLPDLAGVEQADYSLSMGGPVAAQVIVMLLRNEPAGTGIERVTGEIGFSAEQAVLESLLARRKPAGEVRLFVGHAGLGGRATRPGTGARRLASRAGRRPRGVRRRRQRPVGTTHRPAGRPGSTCNPPAGQAPVRNERCMLRVSE